MVSESITDSVLRSDGRRWYALHDLFRQIDQDDIRVLARAVEHDLFAVGRDVERP